ncbi:aminotransferase class V-fold PLP-dependent enzyme [Actinoplanes sp. RD1]|uniref:aminotransferase class V-fold PLP-dependent enzyme n=1 Tax=Actinoplanes sp. RD1 TaxID=3064538 RepID=UPI002741A991|nr:aminotransferase class V-fold PLP-dependent enzyme [Actinoplanes sp. RD1]
MVGDDLKAELPSGEVVRFAHLDYAASAPCCRAAADAVAAVLPYSGSVHRGTGARSAASTRAYEQARERVAEFAGARPGDHVVFTRNTTDALNLLARALPEGTTTVVFAGEHHANLLPWPKQLRLPVTGDPVAAAEAALRSIDGPAVLTVTGASNVTGEVWPLRELAAVAHAHEARFVVDAAQLAPHAPISLDDLGADYIAFSGHKLYAPFGAGALIGRADWLDAAEPYLAGGGASAAVGETPGEVVWATGPARHEGGTPNLPGAVALGAACHALLHADRDALHDREQELLARLRAGLAAVPGVTEVSVFGPDSPRVGIVALAVPGHDPAAIAAALDDQYAIGVRAGQFCAHPLTRHLTGRTAAATCDDASTGLLRISFGLGTRDDDVDRLLGALAELTRP